MTETLLHSATANRERQIKWRKSAIIWVNRPTSVGLRGSAPITRFNIKAAEDDHLPQAKSQRNGKGQLGEISANSDPTSVGLRV